MDPFSERLGNLIKELREIRYTTMEIARQVEELSNVVREISNLPKERSVIYFHERCGLITNLEPLARELRKIGIDLKKGDQITWIVRKSKTGQPIIRAHLKKAKRSD